MADGLTTMAEEFSAVVFRAQRCSRPFATRRHSAGFIVSE